MPTLKRKVLAYLAHQGRLLVFPSDGSPAPITLEFFWVKLPNDIPPLAGNQDKFLYRMIDFMIAEGTCCFKN